MEELKIEASNSPSGTRLIKLIGPLTLGTLFEFQELGRAQEDHPIIVDLAEVPYMDSAGLGAVLGLLASCQRKGRGFAVAGSQDRIRTLFRVTHVDGLIPAFDTVAAAEQQLAKAAGR
jgi:anti-anti-sigma factor